MAESIAVLLAAGKGSRIWPYGELRQKCAIPLAGGPLIAHLAGELLAAGSDHLHVVVGHNAGTVRHALARWDDRVTYVEQRDAIGTADAALCALSDATFDSALIAYGDIFLGREDLAAVHSMVADGTAPAAALVAPLGRERPQDWLCAEIGDGRLTGIEGHPRGGSHRLAGVYALRAEHLRYLRNNPGLMTSVPVGGMPPQEAELAQSVQMMIDDGAEVAAVETAGPFVDVDKPWHILAAGRAATDYAFSRADESIIPGSCSISDGAEVGGKLLLGENVTIGNRVVIKGDLMVGEGTSITNGAIIGPRAAIGAHCGVRDYGTLHGHSTIGDHCRIAQTAEFVGVAFDRVYMVHYCEIDGVLGSAADIGAATVCGTLRFDDGRTVHRVKGRPEVPAVGANASYIGDHSRTGVNAILLPGVKVGCYSCIGPGVLLYDDVPSRKLILAKQEHEIRDWGPERYGW
ncbi:MAG: NTP transferase domain-containing protein [Armatimonadota bacterium]|jgi:bifunctional UDP-N-acetylglucosamine pyrophosphorylase/glucosamine-1-phosphate N-acetyltransferase